MRTTRETLVEMKGGVEWSMVPSVFQDAAKVALKLGIRYLWIDALCIIQNDTKDWRLEAPKMATIYENAHITIAASFSHRPSDPFLGARKWNPREISLELDGLPASLKARDKIRVGHYFSHKLDERDPLDLRGWALQERELSTRFISFTSAELQWSCKTISACECHSLNSDVLPRQLRPYQFCLLRKSSNIHKQNQHRLVAKLAAKLPRMVRYSAMFDKHNEVKFEALAVLFIVPGTKWLNNTHGFNSRKWKTSCLRF